MPSSIHSVLGISQSASVVSILEGNLIKMDVNRILL